MSQFVAGKLSSRARFSIMEASTLKIQARVRRRATRDLGAYVREKKELGIVRRTNM